MENRGMRLPRIQGAVLYKFHLLDPKEMALVTFRLAVSDRKCKYKKHRGESWREVCEQDRQYVIWLLNAQMKETDGVFIPLEHDGTFVRL